MRPSRTIVVGGGIVGLSTAYFLAARGVDVVLIERDSAPNGASSGNAGILAMGHPALPRPGLPLRTLRLLLDRSGPLYISPRFDPALVRWMYGFLRACRPAHYERSLRLLCDLGWEAGRCVSDIIERESIACEYSQRGRMEVFATASAMADARETAAVLRQVGYQVDELSGDQLRSREPGFQKSVHGAFHFTDSAFAHPGRLMDGLRHSVQRAGVELISGLEVSALCVANRRCRGVVLNSGRSIEADRVVLAAGAWTTRLAGSVGIDIPMQAGKGYHLFLGDVDERPSTACVLGETFVAVTPLENGLRLAGTVELSGLNLQIDSRRLQMLKIGAGRYLSGIDGTAPTDGWCGLRPMTADGLPVIGWAREIEGVFVATGHAMMGFLLGPLTGRLTSEVLLDGRASLDISMLRADRFHRGRRVPVVRAGPRILKTP